MQMLELTYDEVKKIKRKLEEGEHVLKIAEEFNISRKVVSKISKWGELLYLYTPQEIRSTSEYVSISIANVLPMHKTSRF